MAALSGSGAGRWSMAAMTWAAAGQMVEVVSWRLGNNADEQFKAQSRKELRLKGSDLRVVWIAGGRNGADGGGGEERAWAQ